MHRWSGIARNITSVLAAAGATCSCSSHTPAAEVAQTPVATASAAVPAANASSAPQPSAASPAPPPTSPSQASSASAAPPAGKMCGGFAGFRCPEKQYCDYPVAAKCGAGDMSGSCKPTPDLCTMEFAPVCGCDGKTYSNKCVAARAGVSVAAQGACKTP